MLFFFVVAISVSAVTPKLGSVKQKMTDTKAFPFFSKHQTGASAINQKVKESYTTPYFYSFENDTISNDGWLISDGSNLIFTNLPFYAPFENRCLISFSDENATRNAWIFSPAISLTAGKTYYVSTYVKAPGNNNVNDEFKITVGSAQTATSQTNVIIDKSGSNSSAFDTWTKLSGTFTAPSDGDYYFAYNVCSSSSGLGSLEFDGFVVNEGSNYKYQPEAKIYMSNGGLFSATNDKAVAYLSPSESIDYLVKTLEVNSFLWSFEDATPDISEDAEVNVVYNSEGDKTASLEATGDGGSNTFTSEVNFVHPADGISDLVWNMTPADYLASYYFTDYNYVVGMNSYYKRVAEKYTIPSNVIVKLNSVNFYVNEYNITSSTLLSKKVTIKICSVGTNGLPGTVLATYTPTFSSLFGTTQISGSAMKTYTLTTPLSITGSFFIDVSFTANTTTPSATNMLALFVTINRSEAVDYNTCYGYYNDGSSSAWYAMSDLVGLSTSSAILPNLSFVTPSNTAVDENVDSKLKVFYSNNVLNIENATPGKTILVYDMNGKTIYTNIVSMINQKYPVSADKGVYFVKVGDKVNKIVIK